MDESLIGNILGGLINRDGDNNNCMGNGGWWIILLMIFFWGGNGFGGWGNAGAQAAMANYATQADITNGFNFNQLQNDIRGVERGLCDTGYENARLINGATNTIVGQGQRLGEAIAQVGFNAQQCLMKFFKALKNFCTKTEGAKVICFMFTNGLILKIKKYSMLEKAHTDDIKSENIMKDLMITSKNIQPIAGL